MSNKSAKKLGFWTALAMLLGSVIGIGIFFKNGSVAKEVHNQGWTWLAAWIIGGLLAATAAISFSEMGFFKNTKITGLGNWAHKVGGKKYGYFITYSWGFFYFGILSVILGLFGSEILLWFLTEAAGKTMENIKVWHHVVLATLISISFVSLNFVNVKIGGWIQSVTTVLKFIPLLLTIFVGIIFATTHNNPFKPSDAGENYVPVVSGFHVTGFNFKYLIAALPAVLFAYDSFLNVASLGKKVKNPTRNIPKIVIIGMFSVIVLYTLVAISSILHNRGWVSQVLQDALPANWANGLSIFVLLFLVFSTFGVINGFSAGFVAEMEQQRRLELCLGVKSLNKKMSKDAVVVILIAFTMLFWSLVIFVPSLVLNSDKVVDGVSNFPTVYFFALHGVTIAFYLWKRFKQSEWIKENRGLNKKGLNSILIYSTGIFAAIGMVAVAIIRFVLLFEAMADAKIDNNGWGFLAENSLKIKPLMEFIFWLVYLLILIALPLVNWLLVKLVEKRDLVKDFDQIAGPNVDDDDLEVVKQ